MGGNVDLNLILGQLGASGIFAVAVAIVARTFYMHYEEEIRYLRNKVDCLEADLKELKRQTAR